MGRSRRGVAAEMPAFGAQSERAIGARGEEFLEHMGEQGSEGGAVGRRQAREHGIGDAFGCPSQHGVSRFGQRQAHEAPVIRVAGALHQSLALQRPDGLRHRALRSEEHTSELQSLMRISYAVFCLKKKKTHTILTPYNYNTYYTNIITYIATN